MNIADKAGLYREWHGSFELGERLAFFDASLGPTSPSTSRSVAVRPVLQFPLTPEETRTLLERSAFREIASMAGAELDAELDVPTYKPTMPHRVQR